MLDKIYQPSSIEARVAAIWQKAQAFTAGRPDRIKAPPFVIVIPPPNVTGSLHMGHALNNTLQDILCRFERMRGKDVLWQPGTDHAGIATQMVVERQLAANKEPDRRQLGREKFLQRVWKWKGESGHAILQQLKRLGASCDWSRERFTMDEGFSQAVLKVFVELFDVGLIYKDKRLVNWDPKFQTAISDLEVVQIEKRGTFSWSDGDPEKKFDPDSFEKCLAKDPSGHMYYLRYPLEQKVQGYPLDHIVVATTRPETLLGDVAVAVHPEDERFKVLVRSKLNVILPLVGRRIPIIADTYSDPEKGTGAVKITPAHDFNDFEVGKRHHLELISVLDSYGKINDQAPHKYQGLDRFLARLQIINDLVQTGLVVKIEPTTHTVPHGDRSNVVIEPRLTDQWYLNSAELAKSAIQAVEEGRTKFTPKNWEKTYFEWMRNIQPWCISRQLWWGHQIPAWYGPDGKTFVALAEKEAKELALAHYKEEKPLTRDEDVLDTWFSSGLWAFCTLGWPDKNLELNRYYPTSVLVTGFDIIFFWVARMMMLSLYFLKEVPFRDVYIHALVRDEKGQKMSKSKGNVIDPIELIDAYGADALRFTLALMAAQGRDIKLSKNSVEGNRNFATKLWNAARFAEMNECSSIRGFNPNTAQYILNKWIAGETQKVIETVTSSLESYRFNEAASTIYGFVWGIFCDWYLELIKPVLAGDNQSIKSETRAMVAWVIEQILKVLHPFMPFVTEELWQHLIERIDKHNSMLTLAEWPHLKGLIEKEVSHEVGWLIELITSVRSVRTELNVAAGVKLSLAAVTPSQEIMAKLKGHEEIILRLARLNEILITQNSPKGSALIVINETTFALPLEGIIDRDFEIQRLNKEIQKTMAEKDKFETWLSNKDHVAKSPGHVVELHEERVMAANARIRRLHTAIKWIEN
ncbi:MAG: valine--tRNA ligase [Hyphomicrobium sp.]